MQSNQSLKLQACREAAGITRRELADKVGLSARQIIRYEDGEQSPTFGVAERLADALGITLDELAGRTVA